MPIQDEVVKAIRQVYDPEIPVNVYDLGLIYGIDVRADKATIQMTLTTKGCPAAQQLPEMVRTRVSTIPGIKDVAVEVVWEPKWSPSRISPEGRKILKLEDES